MRGNGYILAATLLLCGALSGCQAKPAGPAVSSFVPTHGSRVESTTATTAEETPSIVHAANHEALNPPLTEGEGSSRWSKLFGGFAKSKPIPLPRTDLDTGEGFGPSGASDTSSAEW
jgi:hypothetical protein